MIFHFNCMSVDSVILNYLMFYNRELLLVLQSLGGWIVWIGNLLFHRETGTNETSCKRVNDFDKKTEESTLGMKNMRRLLLHRLFCQSNKHRITIDFFAYISIQWFVLCPDIVVIMFWSTLTPKRLLVLCSPVTSSLSQDIAWQIVLNKWWLNCLEAPFKVCITKLELYLNGIPKELRRHVRTRMSFCSIFLFLERSRYSSSCLVFVRLIKPSDFIMFSRPEKSRNN